MWRPCQQLELCVPCLDGSQSQHLLERHRLSFELAQKLLQQLLSGGLRR